MEVVLGHTYLGSLCKRGHDAGNELSIRYRSDRTCLLCHQESKKRNRLAKPTQQIKRREIITNRKIALEQWKSTYLGNLCKRGHDAGEGFSERYTFTRACTVCNRNAGAHKKAQAQKTRDDSPILSPKAPKAPKEVKPVVNQGKPREPRKKTYSKPATVPAWVAPTINQEKIDAEYRQRIADMKRLDYQLRQEGRL
jgi:hypothetical protein